MGVKTWMNEEQVLARVQKATVAPLAKCAILVEAEAKRSLNVGAVSLGKREMDIHDGADYDAGSIEKRYAKGPLNAPPRKRTGNLQNSIQSAKTEEGTYVIGPARTGWYGRIQEFGAMINVTAKMRGWFWHNFRVRLKGGSVYVPPRPFMRPALNRSVEKFPELFRNILK